MTELVDTALNNCSEAWQKILHTKTLASILFKLPENTVPPIDKIFEFARFTKLEDVKIIIIGQDPYYTKGEAHGLAFSSLLSVPPSLRNIYENLLKHNLINHIPKKGNLSYWATQGVLLLNRSLTTIEGSAKAHTNLWDEYIIRIIKKINLAAPNAIFMLWGNDAKTIRRHLACDTTVYEWGHPSPLAQRGNDNDFINCDHFVKANQRLVELEMTPIDWNVISDKTPVERLLNITPMTSVVFTDGSCYPNNLSNKSMAGYAAVFQVGMFKGMVLYGKLDNSVHFASNQRAEGMAIIKTMSFMSRRLPSWDKLIIITDSQFWIDMYLKYMPNWIKYNTSFEEKANPDLTTKGWEVYSRLVAKDKEVEFRHVNSHNKQGWKNAPRNSFERFCYEANDNADAFASYARKSDDVLMGRHYADYPEGVEVIVEQTKTK